MLKWDQKCLHWVFLTQNALFVYFWTTILKELLSNLKSVTLKFVYLQTFKKKQKCLNLGPKMLDLGVFDQKCLIWVFLGQNFKRTIVIFEISNPCLCLIAEYCEIVKMPKFATKSALFGCFWARILKTCCHIWNQHPRICVIAKFCKELKLPKFGTKNAYLGIVDRKRLILVFLGKNFKKTISKLKTSTLKFVCLQNFMRKKKCLNLGTKMLIWVFWAWNLKTILSYLKSAPSYLSTCKFSRKEKKIPKFGTKNAWFGYFWVTILK